MTELRQKARSLMMFAGMVSNFLNSNSSAFDYNFSSFHSFDSVSRVILIQLLLDSTSSFIKDNSEVERFVINLNIKISIRIICFTKLRKSWGSWEIAISRKSRNNNCKSSVKIPLSAEQSEAVFPPCCLRTHLDTTRSDSSIWKQSMISRTTNRYTI